MKRFVNLLLLRNIEAGNLFEAFLISAVASLLGIRAYLHLTNYPQIGTGDFHIAHMLWGGMLMTLGTFLFIGFLSNHIKKVASIISGVGFGAFIDELGKFITADNNYFYKPSIALIYVIFVIFFLAFRIFEKFNKYTTREYAANALETLEDVILSDLDIHEKRKATALLKKADQTNPLVIAMNELVAKIDVLPASKPNLISKFNLILSKFYLVLLNKKYFVEILIVFLLAHSLLELVGGVVGLLTKNGGFAYGGHTISATCAFLLVVLGALLLLKNNRLAAFRMFRVSLLISSLLTQFFLFLSEQLSAVVNLGISLVLLSIVNYFIFQEIRLKRSRAKRAS